MTDATTDSLSLNQYLEKLRFRSWRRGFKELDLILGPWADANLATLSAETLADYEALLNAADWDVFYWITQNQTPDAPYSAKLVKTITDFGAKKANNSE